MLLENRRARDSLVFSRDPLILITFTKGGRHENSPTLTIKWNTAWGRRPQSPGHWLTCGQALLEWAFSVEICLHPSPSPPHHPVPQVWHFQQIRCILVCICIPYSSTVCGSWFLIIIIGRTAIIHIIMVHSSPGTVRFHVSGRVNELGFSFQPKVYIPIFNNANYFTRSYGDISVPLGKMSAWNKRHRASINPLFSKCSLNAFMDIITNNGTKPTFLLSFKMSEWKQCLIFFISLKSALHLKDQPQQISQSIILRENIILWSVCIKS